MFRSISFPLRKLYEEGYISAEGTCSKKACLTDIWQSYLNAVLQRRHVTSPVAGYETAEVITTDTALSSLSFPPLFLNAKLNKFPTQNEFTRGCSRNQNYSM